MNRWTEAAKDHEQEAIAVPGDQGQVARARRLVAAHSCAIYYESIDVALGRIPKLSIEALQDKCSPVGADAIVSQSSAI